MKIRISEDDVFTDEFGENYNVANISAKGILLYSNNDYIHMSFENFAKELNEGTLATLEED